MAAKPEQIAGTEAEERSILESRGAGSRRAFLQLVLLGGASSLAAACGPGNLPPPHDDDDTGIADDDTTTDDDTIADDDTTDDDTGTDDDTVADDDTGDDDTTVTDDDTGDDDTTPADDDTEPTDDDTTDDDTTDDDTEPADDDTGSDDDDTSVETPVPETPQITSPGTGEFVVGPESEGVWVEGVLPVMKDVTGRVIPLTLLAREAVGTDDVEIGACVEDGNCGFRFLVPPGTAYRFAARNTAGMSGWTDIVRVTLDNVPPAIPGLSWTGSVTVGPETESVPLSVYPGPDTTELWVKDLGTGVETVVTDYVPGTDEYATAIPAGMSCSFFGRDRFGNRSELSAMAAVEADGVGPGAPVLPAGEEAGTVSPEDVSFGLHPEVSADTVIVAVEKAGVELFRVAVAPPEGGAEGRVLALEITGGAGTANPELEGVYSLVPYDRFGNRGASSVAERSLDIPAPGVPAFPNEEEFVNTMGGNNAVTLTFLLGVYTTGVTMTKPDGSEEVVDIAGKTAGDTVTVNVEGGTGEDISGVYRFTAVNAEGEEAGEEVTLTYAEVLADGTPAHLNLNEPLVRDVTLKGAAGVNVYRMEGETRVDLLATDIPTDAVTNEDGSVTFRLEVPVTGDTSAHPQTTPVETYMLEAYDSEGTAVAETGVEVNVNGPEIANFNIDTSETFGEIWNDWVHQISLETSNGTEWETTLENLSGSLDPCGEISPPNGMTPANGQISLNYILSASVPSGLAVRLSIVTYGPGGTKKLSTTFRIGEVWSREWIVE